MGWDFLVLGSSGIQGKIVSEALLRKGYSLYLSDLYKDPLAEILEKYPTKSAYQTIDVRNKEDITRLLEEIRPNVVVNCAEGDHNYGVYEACLSGGVSVIDLGSDIEPTIKQLRLHKKFSAANIIGITGCGSTPGINNIMLKHAADEIDRIETIEAGFAWDSNKKEFIAPFSMGSIVYELIFSAPYIQNGKWIKIRNPLIRSETRKFRSIGVQECFIVDHPETYTFEKCFRDKGVKNIRFYASFPKHSLEVLKTLIKLGLASEADVTVEGNAGFDDVSPLDVLTQVIKRLRPSKAYREKEILWVSIYGEKQGRPITVHMECVVKTLKDWVEAGCNIDTGLTAVIIAEMIKNREIEQFGSFVPEQIIPSDLFFERLAHYGMKVYRNGSLINRK